MDYILDVGDAIGKPFRLRNGAPTFSGPQDLLSRQVILMDIHNGGTWVLEMESTAGLWTPVSGVAFTEVDAHAYWATSQLRFRLNGGVMGARAETTGSVGVYEN